MGLGGRGAGLAAGTGSDLSLHNLQRFEMRDGIEQLRFMFKGDQT